MNVILVTPAEVSLTGHVRLTDRRAQHIRDVLGGRLGQRLAVGVIGGSMGQGEVIGLDADAVTLAFEATHDSRLPLPIHLVLAMPRPRVAARIMEAAGAYGVASISLISSWRVEKSYFHSPLVTPDALHAALLRGAEQGKLTFVPPVAMFLRFTAFLEALPPHHPRWLCHPGDSLTLSSAVRAHHATPLSVTQPALVAIGPEGGFIDREVASLCDHGFTQVSLSAATLRCEQAVIAALAQFEAAQA